MSKTKNFGLLILIIFVSIQTLQAQIKIGVKLSPYLIFTNIKNGDVENEEYSYEVGQKKISFRPSVLLSLDKPINDAEKYFFSTGIGFVSKRTNMSFELDDNVRLSSSHTMQYIRVPATLKLFTDELKLDTRVYVEGGVIWDIKVSDEPTNDKELLITKASPMAISFAVSGGMAFSLGVETKILVGLSYEHGLSNVVKEFGYEGQIFSKPTFRHRLFGIEIGIIF